jgi:hypothetical protein
MSSTRIGRAIDAQSWMYSTLLYLLATTFRNHQNPGSGNMCAIAYDGLKLGF